MALIYDPTEEKLTYSFNILLALRDPCCEDHQAAVKTLKETIRADNREFALLMLHIFVKGGRYDNLPTDLRQLAGVIVKNECIGLFNIGTGQTRQQNLYDEGLKTLLDTLQMSLLEGISDDDPDIRRTAAALFGRVAECYEGGYWVPLIPTIVETVSSTLVLMNNCGEQNKKFVGEKSLTSLQTLIEAQLYTLRLVCEDASEKLALHSSRPLDMLVPMFLNILQLSNSTGEYDGAQLNTLVSMNALLYLGASNKVRRLSGGGRESPRQDNASQMQSGGSAIILHMNTFCNSLGSLAYSKNSSIRRCVCQSLCQLMTEQPATLGGGLSTVCEYMAKAIFDVEEGVAIEACEFWFALVQHSEAHVEVRKNIVALIEGAISKCVLTQDEIQNEREDEEMQATGEKKVHFHVSGEAGNRYAEESPTNYTIRRSAALLLDTVSQMFPEETANISLKSIEVLLQTKGGLDEHALQRECGMLALGAIASGCQAQLSASLPVIFPYLLEGMGDALPELRAISCWVQSRYCSWFIDNGWSGKSGIFQAMLHRLNISLLDSSPKVQASCCAAISAVLEASSHEQMITYIDSLLQQLRCAFDSGLYGFKNRLLLMDLVAHIAEIFGPGQSTDLVNDLLATFMPIIMPCYLYSDPDEAALTCSTECLQTFCSVYCTAMRPYASEIFSRALVILKTTLDAHDSVKAEALAEGIEFDLPPVDNARGALELLSSLVGGLGVEVLEVLSIVQPNTEKTTCEKTVVGNSILNLLSRSISYPHDQLRNAALMVAGELLKCAPLFLMPYFTETMLYTISLAFNECEEVHDENTNLLVNASWCLGLISVACGSLTRTHGQHQMQLAEDEKAKILKHLPSLLSSLSKFMANSQEEDHPHTLRANLASAFGRLALLCPHEVSLYLPEVLEDWLYSIALFAFEHECPRQDNTNTPDKVYFDDVGEEYMHMWKGLLETLNHKPDALMESPKAIRAFVHACVEGSRAAILCAETNSALCCFSTDREVKEALCTILEVIRVHKPAEMEASVDEEGVKFLSYLRS